MTDIEKIIKYFAGTNNLNLYLKIINTDKFTLKRGINSAWELYSKTGHLIMETSDREKLMNIPIVEIAMGDVLIVGFGLGMIILPIMNKTEVSSIDIIEIEQEIIDNIAPLLPINGKVKIIHANGFVYKPIRKYDIIYFDTFPLNCVDEADKQTRYVGNKYLIDADMEQYMKPYLKDGGIFMYYKG